jgi:hypothetical protein
MAWLTEERKTSKKHVEQVSRLHCRAESFACKQADFQVSQLIGYQLDALV